MHSHVRTLDKCSESRLEADGPKMDRRYANAMPQSCTLTFECPSLRALLLLRFVGVTSAQSIVPCQARVAPLVSFARPVPSCRFCRGLPPAVCHMESQHLLTEKLEDAYCYVTCYPCSCLQILRAAALHWIVEILANGAAGHESSGRQHHHPSGLAEALASLTDIQEASV